MSIRVTSLSIVLMSCGGSVADDPDGGTLPEAEPLVASCVNAASFESVVSAADDPRTRWGIQQGGRPLVSHDDGASWDSPLVGTEAVVGVGMVVPFDARRAFMVGGDLAVGQPNRKTLALFTADGGRTTTLAARLEPPPVVHGRTSTWAAEADGLRVAAIDDVVYASTDGGASWDFVNLGGTATNGDGSARFVTGADGKTAASWDFGVTQTPFVSRPDEEFHVWAIGPPGHLLLGGQPHIEGRGGIYVTRDTGATWTRVWREGAPQRTWVDPKDDAVWIPLATEQDGIGKTLAMRLLVLHDWGDRSELFEVTAGDVPLIGMSSLRRVGDVVEFIGHFQPTDEIRERLACRVGPGITSRLERVHPAIPASPPRAGLAQLVARRFELGVERTSLAFDGTGNPWVLHDERLMGAAPPAAAWWMLPGQFPFDDWPDGGSFAGLLVDGRGRLLVGQGPRDNDLGALRLRSLDPVTQRLVATIVLDAVRSEDGAGHLAAPPPRRLHWAMGSVWVGHEDATIRLNPAETAATSEGLPAGGAFSPSLGWYAWTTVDPERHRDGTVASSPVLVGPVLSGRLVEEPCGDRATRSCVDYPGEAWAVGVTDDGLVLVLDRVRGMVVARHFDDPTAPWYKVADGFLHATELMVRQVDGADVAFVHDGDVFAFTPEIGVVARRSLASDTEQRTATPPTPFVVPAVPTAEDPYGCVADQPCIRPYDPAATVALQRVVPWMEVGEHMLRGERLGATGTLFVNGQPYPTRLWTDTQLWFDIDDINRPDGEIWVAVDGVESNRLELVSRAVVESVTPTTAVAGDVVSIFGRNFGARQGTHLINRFDQEAGWGHVVAWSDTRVDFMVQSAQSGRIQPSVFKLGRYPGLADSVVDIAPSIIVGCRVPRHETCEIRGASVSSLVGVELDGQPVASPLATLSKVRFDWPADVAPGPHEAVLEFPNGVRETAPVVLEPWARRTLAFMYPQGYNVGAHSGWLAAHDGDGDGDGERWHVATVSFNVRNEGGNEGGSAIPGPPYLALQAISPSDAGLAVDVQALPRRLAPELEDLPWIVVHDGELWTAGSAMSASVTTGPEGEEVVSDVNVPNPREARLLRRLLSGGLVEEDVLATAPGETGRPVGLGSFGGALWLALRREGETTTRLLRRGDEAWSLAVTADAHGGFVVAADALYVGGCGEPGGIARVVDVAGVASATTLADHGFDLLERCAPAPGGGLLAVGIEGGQRSVVRYTDEAGWVTSAPVPTPLPGYAEDTVIAIEDIGSVDDAPALLVAVREGPERGLRLFVWDADAAAWTVRGGDIANMSDKGGVICQGPWATQNECLGEIGQSGCAFFACPFRAGGSAGWRPRAGHVGRARFGHAAGLTTVVYEQWFDDGVRPGQIIGDNYLVVATLTSP